MAANLNLLVPEFKEMVLALLDRCAARGCELRAYFSLRSPLEQAKLWRMSRAIEEINGRIASLEAAGALYLAKCLRDAGPQDGKPVTNALPGYSWHQWGEAVDCFWLVDGAADWSAARKVDGQNGYRVYAEEATALGLTPGGYWTSLKDWPHVQLRPADHPGKVLTLQEIDAAMRQRFG